MPGQVALVPLPSNTPAVQPAEGAWPLVREAVANESFASLDLLTARLAARCRWLLDNPQTIQAVVGHS